MFNFRNQTFEETVLLDQISFIQEDFSHFQLASSQEPSVRIDIPYVLKPLSDYDTSDFLCYVLYSEKYYYENNIFQVYERAIDKRIGWIFPLQSLISIEHEYSDNDHFLKYAFVAFKKLLIGESNYPLQLISNIDNEYNTKLDMIFDSSSIILCISKNTINSIDDFNIDNYFPSLYLNKYYYLNSISDFEHVKNYVDEVDADFVSDRKKTIAPIKNDLKSEDFVKILFKNYISLNQHPLVKFHLLYQVIELLIDRMYNKEMQNIISDASGKEAADLKEQINKVSNEQWRIGKVFEDGVENSVFYLSVFNSFLSEFNKSCQSLPIAIYKSRNEIVHRYREVIDKGLIAKVDMLNKNLIEILVYFLTK